MPSTEARPRTPSVSELQAALEAARQGAFARVTPATVPPQQDGTDTDDRGHADDRPTTPPDLAPSPPARRRLQPPTQPPREATPAGGARLGTWLLGAHGGSGAQCLASVLSGTRSCGDWPQLDTGRAQVALVCRTSHRGLAAAQDYARQFRDDPQLRDHLDLLGVIVSAAAPGRIPPPLRRLERLVSGAVPVLGVVPWQPAWRLGPPQPYPEQPTWLTKLQQALTAAAPR